MPFVVDNSTYERWIFDPEEGERVFLLDGKRIEDDKLEEVLKANPDANLDIQLIPKPEARRVKVTFRPLRTYDKHAIHDLIGGAESGVPAGAGRRLQIMRAVVKWDFDQAWSESVLDNLDPGIEEQIFGWISWGAFPLEQDPETGQPIPLPEATPNRAQRRAASKKSTGTSKPTGQTQDPEADADAES